MDNLDTGRQAEDRRAEGRRKKRRRDHSWARNKPSATTGRSTHIHTDTRIRANPNRASLPNPNRVRASPDRRGSHHRESRGRILHREILPLREIPFLRGTRCHETRCRRGIPFRPGSRSRR